MTNEDLSELIIQLSVTLQSVMNEDALSFLDEDDRAVINKVWNKITTFALENN